MDIQIKGLTPLQKELCDKIWSMDTEQELLSWVHGLPESLLQPAWAMIQMIIAAQLDQVDFGPCTEANEVLDRFRSTR